MRIAVAYDCLFPVTTGGGERQYRLFAEEFVAQGHTVDYLTRRQWSGHAPEMGGAAVRAVSGRSVLYDALGRRRALPALRFALGLGWHLALRRRRYDAVLVSALPVLNVFATRVALMGSRTRMCADFLEVWRPDQWIDYSGPFMGRVAATLQGCAVRVSPDVSCHSQMNGRRLDALGAQRLPVVSPGLIHGIVPVDQDDVPHLPPTVVFAGRHIPDKQVESIPAAIAWARTQVPDLVGTILGDGQQRSAVLAEIARLGLQEVVSAPGFVSQPELDQALRSAACLVNPSRREGYGMIVVEACAHGTPVVVVAGEDNAAVELIDPGTNGTVAASASAEDLGRAIVEVVHAGEPMRQRTREWFRTASTERTAQRAAQQILARLASPRAARRPVRDARH